MAKLTCVHDPLCGWCYGLVPALRHFREVHPNVEIDLIPGGLVTGNRVGPYADMLDYITGAAPRLASVTGQVLGEAFFDMMRQSDTPLCHSAPPSHAILQMKAKASAGRVLAFSHALLEAHFLQGADLNAPETYRNVCARLELPGLDVAAIANATDQDPLVASSYARARELGVHSFPTSIVWSDDGERLGTIASVYEPAAFEEAFEGLIAR